MLIVKENEVKHFNFALDVKGTEDAPTARLVFESGNGSKMFPVFINEGKFSHSLSYSQLKDLGHGNVYLEVLVGKNYFRPWEDKYLVKEAFIQESKKETNKEIITEAKKSKVEAKPKLPEFKQLRLEYKNLLKKSGASFLEGESPRNFELKKKVLTLMENKYGRETRSTLLKLAAINIEELLIY
jgi:hypothetical protein